MANCVSFSVAGQKCSVMKPLKCSQNANFIHRIEMTCEFKCVQKLQGKKVQQVEAHRIPNRIGREKHSERRFEHNVVQHNSLCSIVCAIKPKIAHDWWCQGVAKNGSLNEQIPKTFKVTFQTCAAILFVFFFVVCWLSSNKWRCNIVERERYIKRTKEIGNNCFPNISRNIGRQHPRSSIGNDAVFYLILKSFSSRSRTINNKCYHLLAL